MSFEEADWILVYQTTTLLWCFKRGSKTLALQYGGEQTLLYKEVNMTTSKLLRTVHGLSLIHI